MELLQAAENLRERGYRVSVFRTKEEAAQYLLDTLAGEVIGIGGSRTVEELDVYDRLRENNTVWWHWKDPASREKYGEFTAYLCSVNALAETGEMVNIDGTGNRVASSLYGPKRMFFIIGANKLAPDLPAALARAKASVIPNAERLGRKVPCVVTGKCMDCRSPDRLCGATVIYDRPMQGGRTTEILLIDETLGF